MNAEQRISEGSKTQIVLIATHHSVLFLHPRYGPAHLRALLTKIDPAAVCIEELSDWEEHWSSPPTWPQELYATITWAEKQNMCVWGVDWQDPEGSEEYRASRIQYLSERNAIKLEERYRDFKNWFFNNVIWDSMQVFDESDNDIESMHASEAAAEAESIIVRAFSAEEKTEWDTRNDHITDNILHVASKHPGKRIAVVCGSAHYLSLSHRLQEHTHIEVIPTTDFLPLGEHEIEAGWHNDDAILLLGTNLDSWKIPGAPQSRNHQWSKHLLNRLSLIQSRSAVTRYYKAKWKLLFRDLAKAKEILQGILKEGTHTSIPYYPDRRWSWPPFPMIEHKARFNLATIYDLEDNHEAAAVHYRQLLELEPESLLTPKNWRYEYIDLRSYIENLIVDPYRGGLWEAFRANEFGFYTLACILGPSGDGVEVNDHMRSRDEDEKNGQTTPDV